MNIVLAIILIVVALGLGVVGGYFICNALQSKTMKQNRHAASELAKKAMSDAATAKKEALLEAKEEAHKLKVDCDSEIRERSAEIQRLESRVLTREEQLGKKEDVITNRELALDNLKGQIEHTKKQVDDNLRAAQKKNEEAVTKLETISGMTKSDAKKLIIDKLTDEARADAVKIIREIEDEAKADADKKAREIITNAVQRLSTDASNEIMTSTVTITSDEIKGRLIGREGRNIRAIEAATGVDLIIDDTPEAISISCFDPYRREIAKMAIEKLISDGRIHPGRIEEIVDKAKRDMDVRTKELGDNLLYELKIHGMAAELVRTLGRLNFRTSYGQNQLHHTKEVALIAKLLATEVGADVNTAVRGAVLHDVGKALDHEVDGTHTQIGVDLAKKHRETPAVIHCIEAHHGDVPYESIEAIIVQMADAISSARPGARRENMENYVKRLKELEEIATSQPGVEKAYAISAGREIRIIVKPDQVTDEQTVFMAREVAKQIEEKLSYPGQVKVNVIRESRASAVAK